MKNKDSNGVRKTGKPRNRGFWEDRLRVAERDLRIAEVHRLRNTFVMRKLRKVAGCALSSRLEGVKLVNVMRHRKSAFIQRIHYESLIAKSKKKIPILKQKILFYKSHIQKYINVEIVREVLDE